MCFNKNVGVIGMKSLVGLFNGADGYILFIIKIIVEKCIRYVFSLLISSFCVGIRLMKDFE